MHKILLLLIILPLLTLAQQPVRPVISADYLSLIRGDSASKKTAEDTARRRLMLTRYHESQGAIRAIRIRNGRLTLLPEKALWLCLGGNYSLSSAVRTVNSHPALFDNSIFRTAFVTSQSLSLQANIKRIYFPPIWSFSLKANNNIENTVISENRNTSHAISASADRYFKKFSVSGGYSYFSSCFSNDNTNGFLNRVYQNAMQTPVRFDNSLLLLKNNGHFLDRTQQTANLSLQKKQGDLTFGVINALDAVDENSNQSLKPGNPFFPPGLIYTRKQNDRHYSSNAWISYRMYQQSELSSTARLNYIYNDDDVKIVYPASRYSYHRSSSDAAFTVNSVYDGYDLTAGLNLANKLYASNTSLHNKFFLPGAAGFISPKNWFDNRLYTKLVATYTSFYSEPSISHTLSPFLLTELTPQEAYLFLPVSEVNTFSGLSPMQHQEFTSRIELEYYYWLAVSADFSVRDTRNNVFPVYENNQLAVKNIADTRYKGFELQMRLNSGYRNKNFNFSSAISFYKYSNTVTRIEDGYNYHPIAGFSTVHKALVKGQPVGVIVGNGYHSIIGDPTPDYTLKLSHAITCKSLSLNIDWEYRNGGDIWNGTAGYTGVASSYIQKADNIRIHTLCVAYDIKIRRYLQQVRLTAYAQNLMLWSAYKGADPNQLLYEQAGTSGLDFFNLPSTKTFGVSASIQL